MTKQDHIKHWVETCEDDWLSAHDLFRTKRFLQCLFFAHITIEKLSKAHWVKDNVSDFHRGHITSFVSGKLRP